MYMYAHVCSGLTTHTYASIRESYDYQFYSVKQTGQNIINSCHVCLFKSLGWSVNRVTETLQHFHCSHASHHTIQKCALLQIALQYRRRTNFRGHNISWVKFSRGQIFVGGGSPRKFNPHEKLFTIHETGMARRMKM